MSRSVIATLMESYNPKTGLVVPPLSESARERTIDVIPVSMVIKTKEKDHERVAAEKPRSYPIKPLHRDPPCSQPYKALAEKYKVCGVELEHIMRALLTEENEGVDHAFRQFLMVAKLSAVEPLQQAQQVIKDTEERNKKELEYWDANMLEAKRTNDDRERRLALAKKAMDAPWHKILDDVKALLEADNRVESLHPHDYHFIQAMQKHLGKTIVAVRNGRIRIQFDNVKVLNTQFGSRILETARDISDRHHREAVDEWINDSKNLKAIREFLRSERSNELDTMEYNELMKVVLKADRRVIIVDVNGNLRDGGPRVKGEPNIVYEHRYNPDSNGGYGYGKYDRATLDLSHMTIRELIEFERRVKTYTD